MTDERYRETEPLKKGEQVVMHTCIEARNPKYEGKIWTCKTDQFTRGEGVYAQDSVFLEGFTGSFAPEFLQRVNVELLLAEKYTTIASYEHNRKLYQEENATLRKALEDVFFECGQIGLEKTYHDSIEQIIEICKSALGEGDKHE